MGTVTDRDVMRSFQTISNRRVMVALAFIAAFLAVVIGLLVSGFRDRRISRGAAAVTNPAIPAEVPRTPAKSPPAPGAR
jgi:hypothetical protein